MNPSLAILTLDYESQMGGVQTFLYEISDRMRGPFRITVLAPVRGPPRRRDSLAIVDIGSGNFARLLLALRKLKPDRVLVGHAHPRLLLPAILYGKRYALITHGNDFLAGQKRWHRPLFNWLLRRARPLITNSHANAARLRTLGCGQPIVIYPGTDPRRFSMKQADSDRLTLLTVGRLAPRKGIDTVLQALPAVLSEFPDLHYRIAGEGPDRGRLEALVREFRLSDRVEFLGYIPPERLPAVYQSASVFVMPAREEVAAGSIEGFGIVYLEAAASGLPVIAGRSGGAAEAVRHGETGFLVVPDDPQHLADTVIRLLRDSDLRVRMGKAGREWVEREMNWDRAAAELVRALV